MYRKIITAIFSVFIFLSSSASDADFSKMSSFVKGIAMQSSNRFRLAPAFPDRRVITAFVRIEGNADSVLTRYGCRSLARFGNIDIAAIPLSSLGSLSMSCNVKRIETGQSCMATVDVAATAVNALPAYEGRALPQAFSGNGVVMGIMDIGFDLTHPNFFSRKMDKYRISRFWDQLSTDTVGSGMYVGAEYVTPIEIMNYAHSRDGLKQTHGTHTLGIAAGSGFTSVYRGIAYDSDICLVSNTVSEDIEFIGEDDLYKYTYATDALGFKYIFDYAEEQGKPCVISFSEGSHEDYRGDDVLYYEVLDSLVGPGRIIVASAGNKGHSYTYISKPSGMASAGSMAIAENNKLMFTAKSTTDCDVRIVAYGNAGNDTLTVAITSDNENDAGERNDTLTIHGYKCKLTTEHYRSCYNEDELVCDIFLSAIEGSFSGIEFSVELVGTEAESELHIIYGAMINSSTLPHLANAEMTHSIHSPSSAPSVICVSSTIHRTSFTNYLGITFNNNAEPGSRVVHSSVGPTLDGRIKPDVMAPGSNVISSYSSFYIENNPDANDINSDVEHFTVNGRTYAWNANSGTSMASPVVGGAIALWLQAKPDLSPSDALEVIKRTSRRLDSVNEVPNNLWGYGEIDIYRGLLDILGIDKIDGVDAEMPLSAHVLPCSKGLRILFDEPRGQAFTVRVYSTGGAIVAQKTMKAESKEITVDMALHAGNIYAVQLSSADGSISGSSLIRP
ncbi:MAG: S8 family serine peptidase [Prevotella sp.]